MKTNPSLEFLFAVRDSWGNSSHPQARDRSIRLTKILDRLTDEDIDETVWDSTMACAPPDNCQKDLQICHDK